jgi:arsenate reductase-like glutaredoxin family protein
MVNTKKASGRIFIIFFIVGIAICLSIIGIVYYKYEADNIKSNKTKELKTISSYKVSQITEWFKERMADAIHFSKSPLYTNALEQYLKNTDTDLEKLIDKRNLMIKDLRGFESVLITSHDKIVFSTQKPFENDLDPYVKNLIDSAYTTHNIFVSDLYYDYIKKHFCVVTLLLMTVILQLVH